ncbi:hypothetical protein M0R19_04370 [Candidatus Pacearchaeota archaeon]|nr:hypothetical protein [Candidatus Pacearchaeota archaeon]
MPLFDNKEEVIDFQLTPYGKHLISQGLFKPSYYSFFDDDIIYDIRYLSGSSVELQNDIEDRIFDETIRIKSLYDFESSEDRIRKATQQMLSSNSTLNDVVKRIPVEMTDFLSKPLGSSDLGNVYYPAWRVLARKGKISSVQTSSQYTNFCLKKPQITMEDIIYRTYVKEGYGSIKERSEKEIWTDDLDVESNDSSARSKTYKDGTFLEIESDFILLDIQEKNVSFDSDNFDIEVFRKELTVVNNVEKEELIPLYFKKDTENSFIIKENLDEENIDYYFDLYVDREVDSDILLSTIKEQQNNKYKVVQSDKTFGDVC